VSGFAVQGTIKRVPTAAKFDNRAIKISHFDRLDD